MFTLPKLPYTHDALEPYISKETLEFHYGKHHMAYVNKLNTLVEGTEHANTSLEEIIQNAHGAIYNNAAQIWNHNFYWNSLSPNGTEPDSELMHAIEKSFGSMDSFKEKFKHIALNTFGSGWVWVVKNIDSGLEMISTSNAANPLTTNYTPLLTCDVWEHAYYIDTRNDRGHYFDQYWHIINWDFANAQFQS